MNFSKSPFDSIRNFFAQLTYIPRTLRMIWVASGVWTIAWAVLLVIQGVLPAVTVYLTKLLVDSLVSVIGTGFSWDSATPTLILGILLGSVMLLGQVLQSIMVWVRTAQSELITDYLSELVHQKAITLDLAFYESAEYHDILNRAKSDLKSRPLALLESSGSLVQSTITLVAMMGLLVPYGIWLPFVLLISTIPAFLIVLYFNRRTHTWWKQTTEERRWVNYYDMVLTNEYIAPEVRLFNLGPYFKAGYQTVRKKLRAERIALVRDQGLARLGAAVIGLLASAGAIAWIVYQAFQGAVTLGDLTLFYQSFNRGQGLFRALMQNIGQVHSNLLFLENLFEFLELKPQVVDPPRTVSVPSPLVNEIRFRDVTFRYPGSERTVFEGFNFTIPAGKVVAIVGVNGVGKTTLMKLLCRFYDPEAGSIELDGHDLRTLPVGDLRRMITVMFQYPMVYSATVAENIAMGDPKADFNPTDIEIAARRAGAHDFISRLPQGYETLMTKVFVNGAELSGGERQRLALARAFRRQAQIMVLDEPTSFMDSWSEIDWFDRFRELATGRTAIIITHRFTIAKDADIIYVMDQGRIVEAGNHEELLALKGLYAQSWMAQVAGNGTTPEESGQVPVSEIISPVESVEYFQNNGFDT